MGADLPTTGNTAGRVFFDTTNKEVWLHDGTNWNKVGISSLAWASDVQFTSPQNGQVMLYNSTTNKWVNASITAGSNVAITAPTPGSLQIEVTASGANGAIQAYDAYCRLLMVIDPHASPAECISQRVLFVEEVIERVE